ncbi:hypothetical protein LOK49_LG01G02448 [Camellia lanceoleosa]|uniref:Uncharacterized protein n=1 Tax=Camellia lanceoleosa TaxID=1840588 RepID=A0ACC0ITJ3_9ERIC|nr:hypothetical protein LOK49_LG01G02448 [Camellia lanceoleosa]
MKRVIQGLGFNRQKGLGGMGSDGGLQTLSSSSKFYGKHSIEIQAETLASFAHSAGQTSVATISSARLLQMVLILSNKHFSFEMPGVVSVFPNNRKRLHTTHSWDFMGLLGEETMEIPGYSTKNQVNVVIGFIDTVMLTCLQCRLNGKGNVNQEKNSMLQLATAMELWWFPRLEMRETGVLQHTRKAMARIFSAKTVLGSQPAPQIVAFSSKGPNALTPEILKLLD